MMLVSFNGYLVPVNGNDTTWASWNYERFGMATPGYWQTVVDLMLAGF